GQSIDIRSVDVFGNRSETTLTFPRRAPALDYGRVYPNPATDFVNIEVSSGSSDLTLKIYDSSGRMVRKVRPFEWSARGGGVNEYMWLLEDNRMKRVDNGVYFYRLLIQGEERLEGKIAVLD
ncbi:MAG: T9SS type A sorting domain-containing protein, partial [Candidatus Muiribacteriaceae bacterium]